MAYCIETVTRDLPALNEAVDHLLKQEATRRDGNLDYTCAVVDDAGEVVATGSWTPRSLEKLRRRWASPAAFWEKKLPAR